MFNTIINDAMDESIQSRSRNGTQTGIPILFQMAAGSGLLPPWWSPARDIALRNFWKKSDHLSGAQYNMIAKMTAIPFSAVPRDYTDTALVDEAERETQRILDGAEFGAGWVNFYSKVLEDMLGQDNGWFAEIIGPGSSTGPILGQPITVAHMDSARCQRTGYPEFPVLYQDSSGKLYKLHYSRVMFGSQLPSSMEEMYDVGFCAVSRATMASQNLMDIALYKMEKLGSRPHRELLIARGGLDPEDLRTAFTMADATMDNAGLSRYSKVIIAGNANMPDSDVRQVTFTNLPDGFDEKTAITLGMAVIAMAYGVDARDLFPAMESGATRADALLAHLKQRGKGPGQIIADIEAQFNRKFLPTSMQFTFDFQDDAEDQQIAEIKHIRAQRRQRDVEDAIIDTRTAREQMVTDKDLTRKQFEVLELQDGRLMDGTPVIALFHSSDNIYKKFLALPDVENPLDTASNDANYILMIADEALMKVNGELLNARTEAQRMPLMRAHAALDELKKLYTPELPSKPVEGSAQRTYPTRRENLLTPNTKVEIGTNVPTARVNNIEGKGMNDGPISRLWNMRDKIDTLIASTHQRAPYNLLVDGATPDENGADEKQVDGDPIQRLWLMRQKIDGMIAEATQPAPINLIMSKENTQPIINVQPPNITIQMPEDANQDINISTEPVTISTPAHLPVLVDVEIPETPEPTRVVERQVAERDKQGKLLTTRSVQEYEYGKGQD